MTVKGPQDRKSVATAEGRGSSSARTISPDRGEKNLSPLRGSLRVSNLSTAFSRGYTLAPLRGFILILLVAVSGFGQQRAFLDQYCISCHNEKSKTANLLLDKMDPTRVGDHAEQWEKVVRKLRTGLMPPANARRPDRATIDAFATALEAELDRFAAANSNPGTRALQRLNRTEYANAVRDLLAVPIDTATLLPPDDSSDGFDNIADVLSVSPALMQAYVSAAAKISRMAVGDPATSASRTTYRSRGLSQADHLDGQPFGTRGGRLFTHYFPLDGEYEFRVARAGAGLGQVAVGGEDEVEISINGERVRILDRNTPRDVRLTLKAGPQSVGVALVKKTNVRGVDDLFSVLAASPGIQNVVITGPLNAAGPGNTPSRRRIFVCTPEIPAGEAPCAKKILTTLATRAFRKNVSESDVSMETLMRFYEEGRKLGNFDSGIQRAIARILVDPQFIFRFEAEPANVAAGARYKLSDVELASRLSFFIWSSIPDDELLEVARQGKLKDPAVLERQARRMLADPRADALVNTFAAQWLLLRDVRTARPSTTEFDENLRQSFQRETEMLFASILREDRSLLDLLKADYTFVDERLARHYGIPNIRGSHFRRVTIENDNRRGILGHGSILLATSAANRTSPVKRGKWILENLLGAPPPPPPPGVETNLDEGTQAKATSMRQRLEQHRANPGCAACHSIMDPLGFALENFDFIGKWREVDAKTPIDASAVMVDGTKLSGPASLREALLSRPDAFVTAGTEKLLMYSLGRTIHYSDKPFVRSVVREAARDGYRLSSLVVGIVKSAPFQMKVRKSQEGN